MGRTSDAKDRLIDAAAELFHERGFNGVGVQEICDRAGAQKGSFYHFFKTKNALAVAALDKHWGETRARFWRLAFGEDVAPLDRIRRFFQMAYFVSKQAHDEGRPILGSPFGNAALELGASDEAVSEQVSLIFSDAASFFQQAIDDASRRGDITVSDSYLAAETLYAYFEGIVLIAKARQDPEVLRRLGPEALSFLSAG